MPSSDNHKEDRYENGCARGRPKKSGSERPTGSLRGEHELVAELIPLAGRAAGRSGRVRVLDAQRRRAGDVGVAIAVCLTSETGLSTSGPSDAPS